MPHTRQAIQHPHPQSKGDEKYYNGYLGMLGVTETDDE